jgi:phosphoglycolate phosphatase
MVRPTSVIWDFNGTIMDDAELAATSVSKLLQKRNLPTISAAYHRQIFGFPVADYYQKLGFDLDIEAQSEISDEYHEVYLAGIGGCSLNEGVSDMLMLLQEAGIAQYVLSAAEHALLESWVEMFNLGRYFSAVYGLPDRLAETKVDRGLGLMRDFGLDPGTSLFIGDTDHDIEVAHALGCHPVIVLEGHQDSTHFHNGDCDVFDSHQDLLGILGATLQSDVSA